jgi:DNA-3-methyladenine glycosylase I
MVEIIDTSKERCPWCLKDDLYMHYHDKVWGIPERDSRELWIKLILDGQQAGLSWYTVLSKMDNYALAFDDWNIEKIARYNDDKFEELMDNPGIIRNKLKVNAIIQNARAFIQMNQEGEDFSQFLWSFVQGKTIVNHPSKMEEVPAQTEESQAMSKALKKKGFKFVGPTICYAFMQAVGMVDDHLESCWRK